jgi:hypothetical protein
MDGLETFLRSHKLGELDRLEQIFPKIRFERFYTLPEEKIRQFIRRAVAGDPNYRPRNLLNYFVLRVPDRAPLQELIDELVSWDIVETAFVTPPISDPNVNYLQNPLTTAGLPGHMKPAPYGIDAECAWNTPGGDGAGIGVIDLEGGWMLDHEDLVDHQAVVLGLGSIMPNSVPHGTNVLGVICAVDNDKGGVGIAPNVAAVNVVSHSGQMLNVPQAIVLASSNLGFGDVLVLEVQISVDDPARDGTGSHPIPCEANIAIFDVIRAATAAGIVVVEAAGNGGVDLDANALSASAVAYGRPILNRNSQLGFSDSGAILVGASFSAVVGGSHARYAGTNFGSRIDCYAWGENVATTDAVWNTITKDYSVSDYVPAPSRPAFDGTSAATAIIAGAALSVQGMFQAAFGSAGRLSPTNLRTILSDPNNGTSSTNGQAVDRIGVMPDLCKIKGQLQPPPPPPGDLRVPPIPQPVPMPRRGPPPPEE